MATVKNRKSFKLDVLALFKWESEEWTVKEVALIMGIVMVFIIAVIIALKFYAIPTLGTPILFDKVAVALGKIIKPRAP